MPGNGGEVLMKRLLFIGLRLLLLSSCVWVEHEGRHRDFDREFIREGEEEHRGEEFQRRERPRVVEPEREKR